MARILVAEDNPASLELMQTLLLAFGHEPRGASDGASAVAQALADPPDLLICDIDMPGLNGYGVAARLRAEPALARLPMMAVSAYAMPGDREKSLAAGFDLHVAKPIDPAALIEAVSGVLRGDPPAPALPAATAPADGLAPLPAQLPEALRAPRAGVVLLLVDDGTANQAFKRDLLVPAGYSVQVASDGLQARRLLEAQPVHLVLSDVVMPRLDGFELLRQLRADPRLRHLPFVFLTSSARDTVSRLKGLSLGAQRYLVRPIEPLALLAEIRAVLDETSG